MADSEPDLTQEFIKYMEGELLTYKPVSAVDAITAVGRMIEIFYDTYGLWTWVHRPVGGTTPKIIVFFSSQIVKLAQRLLEELGGKNHLSLVLKAAKAIEDAASDYIKAAKAIEDADALPAIKAAASISLILILASDAANETYENQVEKELEKLLMVETAKSAEDAVPKVMMLILKLCKTNRSPELIESYADLILKIARKIDDTLKGRDKARGIAGADYDIRFFIEAAKAIKGDATNRKSKAEAEARKPTSVSVFKSSGSSAPVSSRPPPPSHAPPSTSEFERHHHADMGGIAGSCRSRSNVRRSYNRSINKSVAKKLKRFISRKY
jgi:hypothetical protein